MWLSMMQAGAAGFHFAASMLLFGALLFPIHAGRPDAAPGIRTLWLVGLVALGTEAVWFACLLVSVTGDPGAYLNPAKIALVLGRTAFGRAFVLRGVFALLFLATLRPRSEQRRLACLFAGLGLASLAGIGHAAAGEGIDHWLRLSVQTLHLLAAGTWFGGLFTLAALLKRQSALVAPAVRSFSRMGYVAVSLIVVTGLDNTAFTTGTLLPDPATRYGRVLAVKLALFAGALALAAINRTIISPRLAEDGAKHTLARNVALEQGLLALVVLAAAVLAMQSPHG